MIIQDQIDHSIELVKVPERIICLVPSITELLYYLGLENRIIGLTKFCEHPSHARASSTIVGGTKNIHHDVVQSLNPDLIIANKEENNKEDIEKIRKHCAVYTSNIKTVDDTKSLIEDLGSVFQNTKASKELNLDIDQALTNIPNFQKLRTAYLIWKEPWMGVGSDTFIHHFLSRFGFENVFAKQTRYPQITTEQIIDLDTELILLSSEPFPFKKAHLEYLEKETGIKSMLIDGSMCSWYGSRILLGIEYLKSFREQIGSLNNKY